MGRALYLVTDQEIFDTGKLVPSPIEHPPARTTQRPARVRSLVPFALVIQCHSLAAHTTRTRGRAQSEPAKAIMVQEKSSGGTRAPEELTKATLRILSVHSGP